MRLYKVRIKTEYILEMEVDAENQADAENLALGGYERVCDETMVNIEILNIEEIENDE